MDHWTYKDAIEGELNSICVYLGGAVLQHHRDIGIRAGIGTGRLRRTDRRRYERNGFDIQFDEIDIGIRTASQARIRAATDPNGRGARSLWNAARLQVFREHVV